MNQRTETLKLLEETMGKIFEDINTGNDLFQSTPRTSEIKARREK